MKNKVVLKAIVLVISWLTISPLFLIYDGWWKLLPKWLRIVLAVFSPLIMIVVVMAFAFTSYAIMDHFHRHHFTKPKVVERITNTPFPEYTIDDYRKTWIGDLGWYKTSLEFVNVPDSTFYRELAKHGNYYTDENDSLVTYSFSKSYYYYSSAYIIFDGVAAYHGDACITVEKGSKFFAVTLWERPVNLFNRK